MNQCAATFLKVFCHFLKSKKISNFHIYERLSCAPSDVEWILQLVAKPCNYESSTTNHIPYTVYSYKNKNNAWYRVQCRSGKTDHYLVDKDRLHTIFNNNIGIIPAGNKRARTEVQLEDHCFSHQCGLAFFQHACYIPPLDEVINPQAFVLEARSIGACALAYDCWGDRVELVESIHIPKGYMASFLPAEDLYRYCCSEPLAKCTFYELIFGQICFYLDVDVAKDEVREPHLFNKDMIVSDALLSVKRAYETAFYKKETMPELQWDVYESCDETKLSFHIVFLNLCFESNIKAAGFMKHVYLHTLTRPSLVKMNRESAIDSRVYTENRCWRLYLQHKANSTRILRHITQNKSGHESAALFFRSFVSLPNRSLLHGNASHVILSNRSFLDSNVSHVIYKDTDIKDIDLEIKQPPRVLKFLKRVKKTNGMLIADSTDVLQAMNTMVDWTAHQVDWAKCVEKEWLLPKGNVLKLDELNYITQHIMPVITSKRENQFKAAYDAALKICGKTDSSFETKQQQYCIDSIEDACYLAFCPDKVVEKNVLLDVFYNAMGLHHIF